MPTIFPGRCIRSGDEDIEQKLIGYMLELMTAHDAPEEQYVRLGLEGYRRKAQ